MSEAWNFVTDQLPLHVENPQALWLGLSALGGAGVAAVLGRNRWRSAGEDEMQALQYTDPDQLHAVNRAYTRRSRRGVAAWALTGIAAGSLGAHLAEPFTEDELVTAERVAVVIEAGQDSFAEDVVSSDAEGQPTVPRLQAALISVGNLANSLDNTVEIDIVLAGSHPESVGTLTDGESADEVISRSAAYVNEFRNVGEPDIAGAISVARATDPDKIVVITQNESIETENAVRDEHENVELISTGRENTEYVFLGQEVIADYTDTFDGISAESADSTKRIDEILQERVTDQIVKDEKNPNTKFKWLAGLSFAATWFIGGLYSLKIPIRRREHK